MSIVFLCWRDIVDPNDANDAEYVRRCASYLAGEGYDVQLLTPRRSWAGTRNVVDGVAIERHGVVTLPLHAVWRGLHSIKNSDLVIDVINGPPWATPIYARNRLAVILQRYATVYRCEFGAGLGGLLGWVESCLLPIYKNTLIVTLSRSIKESLLKLGLKSQNIHVVEPGIDLAKYRPSKKAARPLLLYVGCLKRYKGLELLLRAFATVRRSHRDVQLFVGGCGGYEDDLRTLARRLDIQNSVWFLGYMSDEEKISLLGKAHALVVPSVCEGWETAAIEAAACGTPTVATWVDGLRDSVVHGETGLLIPEGDVHALSSAIHRILEDEPLRKKMSMKAVEWASRFDWSKKLEQFAGVVKLVA